MTLYVAPIVEGETESRCIKKLISRVWKDYLKRDEHELAVLDPNIAARGSLLKAGSPALGNRIQQAFGLYRSRCRLQSDRGFVILLIDADEDCPKHLAPKLLTRCKAARSDADIACVFPNRELENWFKAAAPSLSGVLGLPENLELPSEPEKGRGDAWLTKQMRRVDRNRAYSKPADALVLVEKMNLEMCHDNSRSFKKFCKEIAARVPQPPAPQAEPEPIS